MEGKLINISGVKRSGSTLQFNIARIALKRAGYTVNVCGPNYYTHAIPKGEIDLLKIHQYDEDIAKRADKIFLTDRPWSEVRQSMNRFYDREITNEQVAHEFEQLKKWKWYSDIPVFQFQLWDDFPIMYIEMMLKYLNLNDSSGHIYQEFNNIQIPENGKDQETLLFYNHITRDR